ncbi:hypothetical protein KP509_22G009700 [Ceratopteris richardii]|uniref:GH16 domain-containing protein n=1 Tax=Ceratopteris richardii TaxID=49495 RepID=A0A8T2S5V9_CERRI|nr:hypothetical protein KP509_22G009700 [Ceratopteris richardii]
MARSVLPSSLLRTRKLDEIAVDYTPELCLHDQNASEIVLTFDSRGGCRWRSHEKFGSGSFSARIKGPSGNTSGLNYNFYLSSQEGDKCQDEIDFEFLGRDRWIVQTNYFTNGMGNHEMVHPLDFDSAQDFHEYTIRWSPEHRTIEWLVDGSIIRTERCPSPYQSFPRKSMHLYASVWDASDIDEGRWCGKYVGCDAPYFCTYRDVHVPA